MKISVEIPALDLIASNLSGVKGELSRIATALEKIEIALTPPSATRIIFFVEEGGKTTRTGETMFLKVTESKKFQIKITDRFGNEAKVDGAPKWAVTDESLATLVVAEDGMSATVAPTGVMGSFKVQVTADADLGEGVKPLLGELAIDLVAGEAEIIAIGEAPVEEAPVEEVPATEEQV